MTRGFAGKRAARATARGLVMDERLSAIWPGSWDGTDLSDPKYGSGRWIMERVLFTCARTKRPMTYKSNLASINERFGGEPFPHERAGGAVIDRIDQPANIVID